MSKKKDVHTVKNGDKWKVKISGNPIPQSSHRTQSEAMKYGRLLAQKLQTEHVIHRPNGQIRDKDSYGNDPYPPRDKKY